MPAQSELDLLQSGLREFGGRLSKLADDEQAISLFATYLDEIELWNERLGLVAADASRLVTHHLLDSLAALPRLSAEMERTRAAGAADAGAAAELVDVGSGAGLPGIPLAIAMPERRILLCERSTRKYTFLRNALARLRLENLTAVNRDFLELKEHFPLVVFRALTDVGAKRMKKLVRRIAPGGALAAYKGTREKAEADAELLGTWFEERELFPLAVPQLNEARHLLIARLS